MNWTGWKNQIGVKLSPPKVVEQNENLALPADLDYRQVRGLSIEVQQKLNLHQPETLAQAGRISGVTPASMSLLLVHLKRGFQIK